MKLVATDLDGTLLPVNGKISRKDMDTLRMLGNRGITRVIATGRSFYSLLQHIPRTFPIDYLIFSTGVGVMNWKTGEIIFSSKILSSRVKFLVDHLTVHKLDFMLQSPVPDTHKFYFYGTENPIDDFHVRKTHFPDNCYPLRENHYPEACQALAFIPYDLDRFNMVTKDLFDYKVIRTTSPINGNNMWIEIFEKDVSKGHALHMLAEMLDVSLDNIMAIGNDFNDTDMLDFVPNSYVVDNAPDVLKVKHKVVNDAANSGFSQAVNLFLNGK